MKHLGLIVVIGVGLFLTLPVLLYGFPRIADDAIYHVIWYPHFIDQVLAGDLYPRWLMNLNGGFGSPVFFFYPPVPYYLTGLFRPFFTGDPHGWQQLGVSASAGLTASGLSAYLWLKDSTDRRSAAAGAVVYMLMPYHLAVDLYTRVAFAEFWAFVWLPLILYFVRRIASGRSRALAGLAVSYALLVMTHLPTALIFSPVPIAYGCFLAGVAGGEKVAARGARVLGLTLAAMTLGAGLSAIYLLPALTTQEFVSMSQMRGGFFHYSNWFLFANLMSWGGFSAKLSWMALTVIGAAVGAFVFVRAGGSARLKKESAFWLAAAGLSVFMMTPLSGFVWRVVPPLQAIQFPYRFNVVLALAATALLASGMFSADPARTRLNRIAGAAACSLVAGWVLITAYGASTSYPRGVPRRLEIVDQMRKDMKLSRDAPEYRPRPVPSTAEDDLLRLLQKVGASDAGPDKVRIVEGMGRVEVAKWEPRDILLRVDAPADVTLQVSQFYYPLWEANVNGRPCCLTVGASAPDGLLTLRVPGGRSQEVLLRLRRGTPESAGQIISAISCLTLFSLPLAGYFRRREKVMR